MRTDEHRPSVINPEDYEYVGMEHMKWEGLPSIDAILAERRVIAAHMARTGGTYARHEHGGNCMVCGAWAIYTVLFYHSPSNSYVRTGMDCADKMEMGDPYKFKIFRTACKDAMRNKAGKTKAEALLAEADLHDAWLYWRAWAEPQIDWPSMPEGLLNRYRVLVNIVDQLIRRGDITGKQIEYLHKLVGDIDCWEEREAERKRIHDARPEVPITSARVTITGRVVSTRVVESDWGMSLKMLIETDEGYMLWGSVPKSLDLPYEDKKFREPLRVTFQAGIKRSDRDSKFGFFSRPTKGSVIEPKPLT